MSLIKKQIILILLILPYSIFSQGKIDSEKVEKKNGLALFIGGTSSKSSTVLSVGIDYQYRINKLIGVGALFDYAMGDKQSILLGPGFILHAKNLGFIIAPCIEFSGGDIVYPFRFGVEYDIKMKGFSLIPCVFIDTERNEEVVVAYGLAGSIKF